MKAAQLRSLSKSGPVAAPSPFVSDLIEALGVPAVQWRAERLRAYEYDGSIDVGHPAAVALVATAADASTAIRISLQHDQPVVARGSGTGLSGGAVPARGGLALSFSRMRAIDLVDPRNLRAVVEPGVINLDVSRAVAPHGLYFAPDPSSQAACSIGGNIAENAGGAHCLAYGVTTNHVTGLECVLADGTTLGTGTLSGANLAADAPGYDLTGGIVGSEGTLAVVTRACLRLMPVPEAVRTMLASFPTVDDASRATSGIIAAGIIPAAIEMMDALTITALSRAGHKGLPPDAAAVLLVELEGLQESVDEQRPFVEAILT